MTFAADLAKRKVHQHPRQIDGAGGIGGKSST
jgi:hypothetical protein